MQLFRAIFVLAAAAYVVGQILTERSRLLKIERLGAREARDFHERGRVRAERALVVLTIASAAAGVGAAVYVYGGLS